MNNRIDVWSISFVYRPSLAWWVIWMPIVLADMWKASSFSFVGQPDKHWENKKKNKSVLFFLLCVSERNDRERKEFCCHYTTTTTWSANRPGRRPSTGVSRWVISTPWPRSFSLCILIDLLALNSALRQLHYTGGAAALWSVSCRVGKKNNATPKAMRI